MTTNQDIRFCFRNKSRCHPGWSTLLYGKSCPGYPANLVVFKFAIFSGIQQTIAGSRCRQETTMRPSSFIHRNQASRCWKTVKSTAANDGWWWLPQNSNGCCLLLTKAAIDEQGSHIGNQTGSRVLLFLYTDDFDRDRQNPQKNDIRVVHEPSAEPYGKVAVFANMYGNLWDLIQPVV